MESDLIEDCGLNILCIGDPHFNIKNRQRCLDFSNKCIQKAKELKNELDLIICLGDIFHTHEKAHMLECKDVINFLDECQKICKTILIIGNHDRLNNEVYCTDDHFLYMHNKTIDMIRNTNIDVKIKTNLTIVDKPQTYNIKGYTFGLIPYVEPGRFGEALESIKNSTIFNTPITEDRNLKYIFCHQEFKGCKMSQTSSGFIKSTKGDVPSDGYVIFSGHIHDKQIINYKGSLVIYMGTPFQQRYGEDPDKTIGLISIQSDSHVYKEIDLGLIKLITQELTVKEFAELDVVYPNLRLIIRGKETELNILKKNKKYKKLKKNGVKFSFKLIRIQTKQVKKNIRFLEKFLEIISENKEAMLLFDEINKISKNL